ncbi:hypothetical protein [Parasitella parasitica]|uniref:Uncharacterized protein n=1 Tax=Parasitella parasitica TaxID=35722 RepID=A0A0B7N576_9FUNG|nr:hypothetical protein [Parasitella parasitica]
MSQNKNASLQLQSTNHCLKTKSSSQSLDNNSSSMMMNNDSTISADSDTGTLIRDQPYNKPLTLRVVNPDIYEEDNESQLADDQCKPELNSVLSSPEIQHSPILQQLQEQPEQIVVVPPPNSWQGNIKQNSTNSEQPHQMEEHKSPIIRRVSKTLVEQQYPPRLQYKNSMKLELLPPLEILTPLLTIKESHLLSSSSTDDITKPSIPSSPPQLPQHSTDFLPSSPTKKSPASIAQHSVSALVVTAPEELIKSPEEIEQEELNRNLEPSPVNRHHQLAYRRRQSRDLLREQSPPPPPPATPASYTRLPEMQHVRSASTTPSLTPSSIHPTHIHQQQQQSSSSKYGKASYSLTNHPDAIKLYRSMAQKTKDHSVQLTYAKYLLEIASLYDGQSRSFRANLSLGLPLLKRSNQNLRGAASPSIGRPASITSSRRSSMDTHTTFNTMRRDSILTQNKSYDESEEANNRKKRKMLEDEGVKWIRKLANQNVGEAAYLLALWHERGMYKLRKSPTKALRYYEIAANEKVPEAMFAVGQYYEREQDYMTSFQLYEDAASLGLVEAIYRIAMINLNGEFGSRRNIAGAIQLLIKASEKSTGTCPEAPYTLGLLLTNDYPSINIPSELIQSYGGTFAAITYLEHAAEMGMSAAQCRLGYIYERGLFGTRINISKAYEYYELAANNDNNSYAMLGLSRICNQGVKVPAEQQMEQLANFEQDESRWTKNQPRDEDAAFKWCHSAAKQNLADACYLLGWYYEISIGVPRDFAQAHYYYSKAVKKGNHKEAQNRIQLLESLVKEQKNDKRIAKAQDRRISVVAPSTKNNIKNRESQCAIM